MIQILDSSIAEDYQTRHLFEDLFKLVEPKSDGIVDMTHSAIARRLNIPEDLVRKHIAKLEAPDPNSRDPKEEGRRIVRLSNHRDWGWQIVNWEEYERIRNRAEANERLVRHRANKKAQSEGNGVAPDGKASEAKSKFIPPTIEEVLFQCEKIGLPPLEGQKFFSYFDEKEWKPKGGPVKDWRKRMTTWKLTWESNGRPTSKPPRQGLAPGFAPGVTP